MTDVPMHPQQPSQGDDPYGSTNPVQPVEGLGPDYGMAAGDESWLLDGGDLPEAEPLLHQEVQALPDDLAPAPAPAQATDPEDGWLLDTMDSPAPAPAQVSAEAPAYAVDEEYVGEDVLPGTSYVEPEPKSRPFTRALMPGAAALLLSFGGIALWSFLKPPQDGETTQVAKVTKEPTSTTGGENVELADPTGAFRGSGSGRLSHQTNGEVVAIGGTAKPPVSTRTVNDPREPGELSESVDPTQATAALPPTDAEWTDAAGAAPESFGDDLDAFVEVDVESAGDLGAIAGVPVGDEFADEFDDELGFGEASETEGLAFEETPEDDVMVDLVATADTDAADGELDPLQAALDGMTTDESPELAAIDDPSADTGFGDAIADAAADGETSPESDDVATVALEDTGAFPGQGDVIIEGPDELPFGDELVGEATDVAGVAGVAGVGDVDAVVEATEGNESSDDWDDWGDDWDETESVEGAASETGPAGVEVASETGPVDLEEMPAGDEVADVEEASPWDLSAVEVADVEEPLDVPDVVAAEVAASEGAELVDDGRIRLEDAEAHARLDAIFGSIDAEPGFEVAGTVGAADVSAMPGAPTSEPTLGDWDLRADSTTATEVEPLPGSTDDPWSQDATVGDATVEDASEGTSEPTSTPTSDDAALAEVDPWVQGVPEISDEFPAPTAGDETADAAGELADDWDMSAMPVEDATGTPVGSTVMTPPEGTVTDEVALTPVDPAPVGPAMPESGPAIGTGTGGDVVGPVPPTPANDAPAVAQEPKEVDVEVRSSIAGEGPRKKRSGILTRVGDDTVWRHKSVPKRKLDSKTMVLTPNVGVVRVVFDGGESIDGRLHAVGQNKVVLDTKMGRMSIDGRRTDRIDRLSMSTRSMQAPSKTGSTAGLQRVRVKAKGGVFYGHLVSQEGDQVTLLLDEGFKLTLTSNDVVPVVGTKSRGSRLRRVEPKTPKR
ncbi:MAG: hypothetical protein AAF957_12455 [Planctomycetota bacterium]